jgi:hypothetical protein
MDVTNTRTSIRPRGDEFFEAAIWQLLVAEQDAEVRRHVSGVDRGAGSRAVKSGDRFLEAGRGLICDVPNDS